MRKISYFLLAIILCVSLAACVSDAEYQALEERVSYLEKRLGVPHPIDSEQGEKENKHIDNNTEVEDKDVTSNDKEDVYVYCIDNLSEQEICDEIMYYLNNLPYQNQSYDDYESTLKIAPVFNSIDYGQTYYFYDPNLYALPNKDIIYSISIGGTYPEMDGTMGIGDNNGAFSCLSISVNLYITDYNKASILYDLLYDKLSPYYEQARNSKDGTRWQGGGYLYLSNNYSMSEHFITMEKRQEDVFEIHARLSRNFEDVR